MKNEILIAGMKYRGELLMCDYGFEGLNEDTWYVVTENGEVKEVEE